MSRKAPSSTPHADVSARRMPSPGDTARALTGVTATGEPFDLSVRNGRWTVVYFFPRSNTPG